MDSQDPSAEIPDDTLRATNGDPIAIDSAVPTPRPEDVPIAPGHVAARMASTIESSEHSNANQGLESFDLANHPALQFAPTSIPVNETAQSDALSPSDARPAYSVVDREKSPSSTGDWPQEVLHVVRNGDTLEGLAERYLDDPGRGLEIFDLNRDQLSNPYLLPIGVELRIPQQSSRPID
ncbi:hypothetical protein Pla144_39890 [Bythopirellula polymerisocia]|uniref:LysM domain-containing protein n=2 Tax=Bythopirellula polymerisocia TaxID=2528003 RepID=A0A5C6CFV0_9BACT|nr:hypothetical protein Pla144_39890 [Bythopirellula polymerisocia]